MMHCRVNVKKLKNLNKFKGYNVWTTHYISNITGRLLYEDDQTDLIDYHNKYHKGQFSTKVGHWVKFYDDGGTYKVVRIEEIRTPSERITRLYVV